MQKNISENEAIKLLKKYAPDDNIFKIIVEHSKKVQTAALKIANKIPDTNIDIIKIGSLLHDIGRFRCPPKKKSIRHGIEGGKILRKMGFPQYARIAERHIGVGIKKSDIIKQKLDLPKKDFVPTTKEEKIIAYADNLVAGDKIKDISYVLKRYEEELGKEYVNRIIDLHNIIENLKKGNNFLKRIS